MQDPKPSGKSDSDPDAQHSLQITIKYGTCVWVGTTALEVWRWARVTKSTRIRRPWLRNISTTFSRFRISLERNSTSLPKQNNFGISMSWAVLRILDVYLGSQILIFTHHGSRIPDTKTATKERGEKKICCHIFFCSHKFTKIENYFIFEMLKEKMWANFLRIIELFTRKVVTKLSKIWVWDPGSEIRDPEKNLFRIPDLGLKKAPDPGSGSTTLELRPERLERGYHCWLLKPRWMGTQRV